MLYFRPLRPLEKRNSSRVCRLGHRPGKEDIGIPVGDEELVAIKQVYGRGRGLVAVQAIRCRPQDGRQAVSTYSTAFCGQRPNF